ncbi:MAG: hypothetical protein ACOYJE_04705 [Bacteroidaceae bacterium]|jgi:hypothetical protein
MKKTLFYVTMLLCTTCLTACGDDDNDFQTITQNLELHMGDTKTLPAGSYSSTSTSNPFVATVSQSSVIIPQHVGKAVINAVNPNFRYIYNITVVPSRTTFTDLGGFLGKTEREIKNMANLRNKTSNGRDSLYYPILNEDQIAIRYNSEGKMYYGMLYFNTDVTSRITEQLEEYYQEWKSENGYTIYIDATSYTDASIVVARKLINGMDRLLYLSPETYDLIGDLSDLFGQ